MFGTSRLKVKNWATLPLKWFADPQLQYVEQDRFDRILLWVFFTLLLFGIVMVFSASVMDPDYLALRPEKRLGKTPEMLNYLFKDLVNTAIALGVFTFTLFIPLKVWNKYLRVLLFLASLACLVVLAFGIGREINGAVRWLDFGFMLFQPGELTKLALCCFLASYIHRHYEDVLTKKLSLAKPVFVTLIFAVLLSFQPDTGTAIVLFCITLGMFFLAGVKLGQLILSVGIGAVLLAITIINNPYKLVRLTHYLTPFDDPYGNGYQLANSLIAFGRGDILGEGLGNSVQKLAYLPESHTDFILSVTGEELGFIGILAVLILFGVLMWRMIVIVQQSLVLEQRFAGFFAMGIATWFFCQGSINLGAALGILPTKGLTFPFISYGGSSLMIMSCAMAILLRIDYENRQLYFKTGKNNE